MVIHKENQKAKKKLGLKSKLDGDQYSILLGR